MTEQSKSWWLSLRDKATSIMAVVAVTTAFTGAVFWLGEPKIREVVRDLSGAEQVHESITKLGEAVAANSVAIAKLTKILSPDELGPVVEFNLSGSNINDAFPGGTTTVEWSYQMKRMDCSIPEITAFVKDSLGVHHVVETSAPFKTNVDNGLARYSVSIPEYVPSGKAEFWISLTHTCPSVLNEITSTSPSLYFEILFPVPEPRQPTFGE